MSLPPRFRSARRVTRPLVVGTLAATLAASGLTVALVAPAASAASIRVRVVQSANDYARSVGVKAGIAVLDTKTGELIGNSSRRTEFASESVIKVMIAVRLIKQGRMHGSTSTRAKRMIACSNDGIANSFYGSVGGDGLLSWTKSKYKVPTLGRGPIRGGWWGSNRITAEGMVRLYAKLKADRQVWPWLYKAMRAHTTRGCDGFYQGFGLPQAASSVAVKQGWGSDYSYRTPNASMNSTGFVGGGRYAIAILARGKASTYGSRLGNAITGMAKRLLPGRAYPSGAPVATSLSTATGVAGTSTIVRGAEFVGVRQVSVGGVYVPFKVLSQNQISIKVPARRNGPAHVFVRTSYGLTRALTFRYNAPPPPVPAVAPSSPATVPSPAASTAASTSAASTAGTASTAPAAQDAVTTSP